MRNEKAILDFFLGIAGFLTELFSMLEPCEVKVSCTVLRGLGAGNSPRLPDPS